MRLIKTIGLAAMLALTAMAFVGASSATATQSTTLCKINQLPCLAGNQYGVGTKFLATLYPNTTALLLSSVLTVHCLSSDINAKIVTAALVAAPNPLLSQIESISFTDCHNGCTVAQVKVGHLGILKLSPGLGDAFPNGLASRALVNCSFIHCVYEVEANQNGEFLSSLHIDKTATGKLAQIHANALKLKVGLRLPLPVGI